MRAQLAMFLVLASGVAGCASTPPPPPPMAMAEPAPAPAPPPIDGMYSGSVSSTDDSRPRCHKMPSSASATVTNNMFMLHGIRGKIGPDGTVTSAARRGTTLTGTAANGVLDVTSMAHGCGYHYMLNHAA